jgi:acetyl-CoA acyltransferase
MSAKTYVIGVGMTKFDKPGTKEGDYPDWAKEAGQKALQDAGIPYDLIEQRTRATCMATRATGSGRCMSWG